MMARGDTLLRQWNLLMRLQTRGEGIPLNDLAEQFEVTPRTIQRDFETLQELGFPIDHEDDDFGKRFWRMPSDFFKTGPLVLSLTEAVSLHLADRLLMSLAGTHFADGLEAVLEKVRNLVPAAALEYFTDRDDTLYVRRMGITDYRPHAGTIRSLDKASREARTVEVTYRSLWRDDRYITRFDPYGMVYHYGDLFVVGHSHRADAIRILKITRILEANLTPDTFDRPEDYTLEQHFRNSFGVIQSSGEPTEVVAKFYGRAALLVEEREWHESQQLQWQPVDDTLFEPAPEEPETLIATFRLANMVEFKQWIKGFGDQAEVLRPDWLREEMRTELQAAVSRYSY